MISTSNREQKQTRKKETTKNKLRSKEINDDIMKEPSKFRNKQNKKQRRTFYHRLSKKFRLMKKLVRPDYFINMTTECVSVM